MANAIDGIGAINVSTIVSQLMALETRPQSLLKAKLAGEQKTLTILNELMTNLKSVGTASKGILGDALTPAFTAMSAKASHSSVSVSATSAASPGQMTFSVDQLAAQNRQMSGASVGASDVIVAGGNITITPQGGSPMDITVGGTGTISDVVTAINAQANAGVRAASVAMGDGTFRLQLTSTASGAASNFTVDAADLAPAAGGMVELVSGRNARINIGSSTTPVYVESTTNTFSNVVTGLSFTVSELNPSVTVTVDTDRDGLTAKVKGLVDAVNASIDKITANTLYNSTNKTGGALMGNQTVSKIRNDLGTSVMDPAASSTLAGLGIQLDRGGRLTFDEAKFKEGLTTDFAGTKELILGFATRTQAVATNTTATGTGTLSAVLDSRKTTIADINSSISDWDDRLKMKESSLTRQFAALNSALANLNSQSSYLASQLAKLG